MQVWIYNKSAETAKTNKGWLEDVWATAGYNPPVGSTSNVLRDWVAACKGFRKPRFFRFLSRIA